MDAELRKKYVGKDYVCYICGMVKNDNDSRFCIGEGGQLFCWECREVESLKDDRKALIDKMKKDAKKLEQLDKKILHKSQENQACTCGHPRSRHSGIEKWCYVAGCQCKAFEEVKC